MRELLLIETVTSPCGWIKSTLSDYGCNVTRVLHVKQAERALRQAHFDLILLAGEGVLPCLTDVKRLRVATDLPVIVVLPQTCAIDETSLLVAGVNKLINVSIPRHALWEETKTVYDTVRSFS